MYVATTYWLSKNNFRSENNGFGLTHCWCHLKPLLWVLKALLSGSPCAITGCSPARREYRELKGPLVSLCRCMVRIQ
jgi:hypothetical protein